MCIDAKRMRGSGNISWRCYGHDSFGELKRDLCVGELPPTKPPEWCPKRIKREIVHVQS